MAKRDLIIHGHFYQPPRENPWTGRIGRERSAAPFHDWNERIDDECYRPNAFGRVVNDDGEISGVINNYELLSFNFGPTLVSWLAEFDPLTLGRIVQADRQSIQARAGHGNAIAQGYNHIIMPLADRRDRHTQIRWGLASFAHTFGREAEALWLPETAANQEVLDDLIDFDMRFVILAPEQAGRVRPVGEGDDDWNDVSGGRVDPGQAYLYRHRDEPERTIAVFFYDGPLARHLAFGDALEETGRFFQHIATASGEPESGLVNAAVDGETAGHHHAWGDRVLAHALGVDAEPQGYAVMNYSEYLAGHAPQLEVELDLGPLGEGSSWSCAHGVGRWIRDCGCHLSGGKGWNQSWRGPLRDALDLLRDRCRPWYEEEAGHYFDDAWAARDAYIEVVLDPGERTRARLLAAHGKRPLDDDESVRAFGLLELQHYLMLMYTSCGWFFDDIAGLESMQVLRYAARALDLWSELGGDPPGVEFVAALAMARSNDPERGSGADLLRNIVTSETLGMEQTCVHALMDGDARGVDEGRLELFAYRLEFAEAHERDGERLLSARVDLEQLRTGQRLTRSTAVLEGEGQKIVAGVTEHEDERAYATDCRRLGEAFDHGGAARAIGELFVGRLFDEGQLLASGGREFLQPRYLDGLKELRREVAGLHHSSHRLLAALDTLRLPYPDGLLPMAELAVQWELEEALRRGLGGDLEGLGQRLTRFVEEARRLEFPVDLESLGPPIEWAAQERLAELDLDGVRRILGLSEELGLSLPFHRLQESFLREIPGWIGRDGDSQMRMALAKELGMELGFSRDFLEELESSSPGGEGS